MSGRKLNPKMKLYIDQRLANNPLAQEIIKNRDVSHANNLIVEVATCLVGIREKGGNNHGTEVELIQDTVGSPQGQPWCMDANQTLLAYVELVLGIQSAIIATEGCDQAWQAAQTAMKVIGLPLPGNWVIWGHYDAKGHYKGGHTGIVKAANEVDMYCYEGNTTGGLDAHAQVIRDGGGYYLTKRTLKGSLDMKVRGFIKPF